ncbi:MAG: type IV secretion system protein [Rhodoferax sp.]|nr:type IV secretion system protein [Rhodoferax sp.]
MGMASHLIDWWQGQSGSELPNMIFFQQINDFLDDEIREFAGNLLGRMAALVGGVVLTLLTLWIIIQGYRITTGQSRDSMMALVTNSLRAALIIGIATGAAAGAGSIYSTLTNGLNGAVNEVMTGNPDGNAYKDIDKALAIMQVGVEVIDSVDASDDVMTNDRKDRAVWFTGIGLGGPATMAATALLLNKIAMALIVGLGPLFILCLLFEQTKQLFHGWVLYGIGTLFSMALLSVMVTLALDMVIAVGLAFWVSSWVPGASSQESLTSMAMQQGGLGVVMTAVFISAPPLAAMLFKGTLGQFYGANSFASAGGVPPASQPGQPGYPGYSAPPQAGAGTPTAQHPPQATGPRITGGQSPSETPTGQRGLANKEERSP